VPAIQRDWPLAAQDFEARLSAFPALSRRLAGAACGSDVRGAGPMRQDVRRRVYGRVLLVGDASGYLDALTGEGLSVGLAQAEVLARCLVAGRPGDYERAWRKVSGPAADRRPAVVKEPAAARLPACARRPVRSLALFDGRQPRRSGLAVRGLV
jgi:flavin-dependent dehydrogenase